MTCRTRIHARWPVRPRPAVPRSPGPGLPAWLEILALAALLAVPQYALIASAGGAETAGAGKREADWVRDWCTPDKGATVEIEHALSDRTRVDCLAAAYAIEFDYAPKWAEAIGQALYYGAVADRQPGIVLIVQDPAECRFVGRLRLAIRDQRLPIQLWTTPRECPL